MKKEIKKWRIFEESFKLKVDGNPFLTVDLSATFTNESIKVEVQGFYDGDDNYVIRFMPQETGQWKYTTKSNYKELNGITGEFICVESEKDNHGQVVVKGELVSSNSRDRIVTKEEDFHFSYLDGTPYYPFGTTCYAWIHQDLELQEKTLKTLKNSPFNKIRMCLFPKHYAYNFNEPIEHVYEGNINDGFNFKKFNINFFKLLEKRIMQLDDLGIEADIILFHPYDRWGFSKMTNENDYLYLKYVVSRLSAFKNVWWSLANEFDLMTEKTVDDWEFFAKVIQRFDPYNHLRSIHNCKKIYDHTKPWITHCSIQRVDIYKTAECTNEWRELYKKPIVIDECGYEGNINYGWGNITGEDMVRKFWEATVRGGYLGHGETYTHPQDIIWWSHGGDLHGSSIERIKFLRKIVEEAPGMLSPLKITPENERDNWDVPCANIDDKYRLYYFGFSRPSFRTYKLPVGKKYRIDIIDTWDMTIKELEGEFSGDIRIELPGKQYIAVRMTEV